MVVNSAPQVRQAQILVAGQQISTDLSDALFEVEVDTSMTLPSMFVLRFHDNELSALDGTTFDLGKAVEIKLQDRGADSDTLITVLKGEITAIEPIFDDDFTATLVVRGYDKSHRLLRGTNSKVYVNAKDSDIVSQLAGNAGLSPNVTATQQVFDHVFQDNQTDLEFLHMLAARNGFEATVDDDAKLYFGKPRGQTKVDLEWGTNLLNFNPRLTLSNQVDEVVVKGWDPKQKKEIVGTAKSSTSHPSINVGGSGGAVAKKAFSSAQQIQVRQPIAEQRDADTRAQAILDAINAHFVEAEGRADGSPSLVAGKKVAVKNVGTKFSGDYIVTSATHIYTPEGYHTYFTIEGARRRLISDLMQSGSDKHGTGSIDDETWGGVVPAIVTNVDDEEALGRIKVKFPWLDDKLESTWARVVGPGAGKGSSGQGIMFLPEVNDEVLVAFEHGNFNYPYVIGGLWNTKDKPPENPVANGKIEKRIIQSRAGHIISMDDTSGSEKIEIIDCKQGTSILFDAAENNLKIDTKGKVDIASKGDLTLDSKGNITIKATGDITIDGKGNGTVKSAGPMAISGATVAIN